MSFSKEVRIVNFSSDQAYKHLLDFLNKPETRKIIRVKTKESREPSHIRIKMGVSSLEINIYPQDINSRIELTFDFTPQLNITVIGSLLLIFWAVARSIMSRSLGPFLSLLLLFIIMFIIFWMYHPKQVVKNFMDAFDLFFLRLGSKVEVEKILPLEVEISKKVEDLYEQLLHVYTNIYGGGKRLLGLKIESLMKQGLSQEEAIHKLAEREKIIEKG